MTKYGYNTIGLITIIAFILIAAGIFIQNSYVKYTLIVIAIFLILFTINFFRDPERSAPARDDVVVSPADGTVVLIKKVTEDQFIKENAWQISIFMSPLNVHVNRIPIDGTVNYLQYHKGEYLIATDDKASEKNERAVFGITGNNGKVMFTQIAGYVARRIIYEIKPGDEVKMGERFGMIKFGSRVDVIVPEKWNIKVKKGDIVTAGETILYELNQ